MAVRFSNRPFGVKRFQTIHQFSVDAARGLVLLFGIGTKAIMGFKTRWNNLWGGLAVRPTGGPSGHTNPIHRPARDIIHRSVEPSFLLSHLIAHRSHAAATSAELGAINPDGMITANRRARAKDRPDNKERFDQVGSVINETP